MGKVSQLSLIFDLSFAEAIEASQQWILSAMQKHGPGLVSMLWRMLGNEQDVCDIYQDTFLQLAHCRSGRKPRNVKAYLFKAAGNNAISLIRRKKTYDKTCRDYAESNDKSVSTPIQDFDSNHLLEEMRSHLARLPEHLRNVVILRDLGEMSYTEVANILNITVGTARVYRYRAIQLIAALMMD